MHSLVFCPVQSDRLEYKQDTLTLKTALQKTGLIAHSPEPASSPCTTDFLAGERFLDLMVFMGCSPAIQLKPNEQGSAWCYISFQQHSAPGKIYAGSLSRPARCGMCKSPLETEQLLDSLDKQSLPTCPQCQTQLDWSDIIWNKTIGMARDAILIHNIFPHEAIPADELINAINTASGISWRYFYI